MPTVFVYEFITAGGWRTSSFAERLPESLLLEGHAMLSALADDFARIPGVTVRTLRDEAHEEPAFRKHASESEWTVVIAPEFDQLLSTRATWVLESGGRLLGPSLEIISLCSDKHALCEHLTRCGIPTPRGGRLEHLSDETCHKLRFPLVLKRNDGAGSLGMQVLHTRDNIIRGTHDSNWRIEEYQPGLPASVSILCGPAGCHGLPPCTQQLADNDSFQYLGGRCPLPTLLAERASRLALRAIATLQNPLGYLGVDLVLAADPTGRNDVVIEMNPRLTTSYVGLRALSRANLAEVMLQAAAGLSPRFDFATGPVEFRAVGAVRNLA